MAQTVNEIRQSFLEFFEKKTHQKVRSSPLIPADDPTLLFTNAGMVQFKDYFTGKEKPEQTRATTCQKCVRAGGKHNDLESVGVTKRHHTFFEMLGNFSFGDYFKREAIQFAWEYLTEVLKLPKEKLWASVFEEDDEAYEIWTKEIGLPKERVVRMGEKDNFWAMGDTGPCGPCSEIYIDRGESYGKNETIFDGGERYLEIWNLVFMQYERFADGEMKKLPKPSVDTGMGLERLASVIQDTPSNYEIDSMNAILSAFEKSLKVDRNSSEESYVALKVLTDHIRSVSFLMADGIQPSNEGRGYVLRRILRRAVRYGRNLGQSSPFFYKGVGALVEQLGDVYPELKQNQAAIEKIIFHEEEKFFETLDSGLKLLETHTQALKKGDSFPGEVAFQLYDTYGFPVDLTEVILREKGLRLDLPAFDKALEAQRERSRQSWKGGAASQNSSEAYQALSANSVKTEFTGYQSLREETKILGIIQNSASVSEAQSGYCELVLEKSPFYPESGGQIGDQGWIKWASESIRVLDTQKPVESFSVVSVELDGQLIKVGQSVVAEVDADRRGQTRIHHTMTHVLHAALQEILGDHIKQAGSLVTPDYLRFDFSHFQALTKEEIRKIETYCNQKIRENPILKLSEESLDKALASGAKAFFEEKYKDEVRVLRIGSFSTELCGGTHAESLAEAGFLKITSESSVASGVRRIVAVTARAAERYVTEQEELLETLADKLKAPKKELSQRVEKLLKERSELQKKLQNRQSTGTSDWKSLVEKISGVSVLIDIPEIESSKDLRPMSDDYKNRLKDGVILLGHKGEGKATVVVSVAEPLKEAFRMKEFVVRLGELLEGKGGGREDFAQVGGQNVSALNRESLKALTEEHMKGISLKA